MAHSKCVFPLPGLPKAKTFSQRSRNSPSNNVFVTNATFGGRRFRLKFANDFSAGMRDWLSSRWIGWVQIGAAVLIVGVGLVLTTNAWRTVAMVG